MVALLLFISLHTLSMKLCSLEGPFLSMGWSTLLLRPSHFDSFHHENYGTFLEQRQRGLAGSALAISQCTMIPFMTWRFHILQDQIVNYGYWSWLQIQLLIIAEVSPHPFHFHSCMRHFLVVSCPSLGYPTNLCHCPLNLDLHKRHSPFPISSLRLSNLQICLLLELASARSLAMSYDFAPNITKSIPKSPLSRPDHCPYASNVLP